MTVGLYARVSRDDLNNRNQWEVLGDWAQKNGIQHAVHYEETMSTRKTRPVKEQLIKDFRSGKIDTIVVVRIDRFARSLQELVMDVEQIINNGGRFVALMNGIDFDKKHYNASNQLMLNIFSAFAMFEREIIRERTLEGLARAKAQGKKLGRPRKDALNAKTDLEALEIIRNKTPHVNLN